MSHSTARRSGLARDESDYRLLHAPFHKLSGGLFGGAADLADHNDGIRPRIGFEEFEQFDEDRTYNRISSDADACRLAYAELGQLIDRFICESSAARDDSRAPFFVNVSRHNSYLAFARRDYARTVRPYKTAS